VTWKLKKAGRPARVRPDGPAGAKVTHRLQAAHASMYAGPFDDTDRALGQAACLAPEDAYVHRGVLTRWPLSASWRADDRNV